MRHLEIKRFDTFSSDLFDNGVCACLSLDDYAKEETVKCKIANIGDEITPDGFYFNGNPYFSYETYLKYSKGEHYARIYVEVEYESKELEIPESIFNTRNGINNYITDLKTLHDIMNIRSIACKKKKIKLNEFIWRGILKFDEFGQTMFIYNQKWIGKFPNRIGTINAYDFSLYCEGYIMTFRNIPEPDEVCPQCGKKWTIENISDYITIEQKYKHIGFHKDCLKIHNNQEELNLFKEIFSKVYDLNNLKFAPIPNEYCSCERCSSWFIVSTPDGDIKIGWRKRVINIKWLDNYKPFAEKFESEDVTRGFGNLDNEKFIHAWSTEKAAEYLNKAKNSII